MKRSANNPRSKKPSAHPFSQGRYETVKRFPEAEGKTIAFIEKSLDEHDGIIDLAIEFTDGTAMTFDVSSRPRLTAEYSRIDSGDAIRLQDYKSLGW